MICPNCKQEIFLKKPLTKRMTEVLNWITHYVYNHEGISPSYDEIKIGIGLKNKSEVARYIMSLQERGHLTKEVFKARTLQLL